MRSRWLIAGSLLLAAAGAPAWAAKNELPIGQREPVLRVEGNGPTSSVTALAFSPDGQKLYAAGYDKVVRVWTLDKKIGRFVLDRITYRVLVGPGLAGAINTIAVSSDGNWLGIGGLGVVRGGTDFRSAGFIFPQIGALDASMREDQGMIYVYKTDSAGNQLPETHLLRGHRGPVLAMRFVPGGKDKVLLVSAALEWNPEANAFAGVLRVWDVRKEACIAELSSGLPNTNLQPGLAVWSVGKKAEQIRVAAAWGDGSLRLWDVERGAKGLLTFADGPSNTTAAFLPRARQSLITTSFRRPQEEIKTYHGQIQAWDIPEGFQQPTAGSGRTVLPRTEDETNKKIFFLPKALVPFSAHGNGTLDHAAVLFRLSSPEQKDRLQLIDLDPDPEQFGKVKAEVPLWLPGSAAPVLAAASRGQYLAVAGDKEHEIVVYSISDLLKSQVKSQTLRSAGATVGELAFVQKGKSIGLKLRELGDREAAPMIFDFSQRSLIESDDAWKKASPDLGDWTVDLLTRLNGDRKEQQRLVVSRQNEPIGPAAQLKPTQRVTSYALLPPMKPLSVPLLALAYLDYESGEATLALYNAATGERVRQLAGHVDPVRGLAFSSDGKLLASAAEDQTVCVWSTANLDQVVGQRGMLPELAVAASRGGVVVKQVKQGSPAFGKVVAGDLVEGLVLADDQLAPIDSPRKFYETMWQKKPGSSVTLRVKEKEPIQLKVGQGVDERNPLLSLFITRAGRIQDQEWIGWSPLGFYDASAPKAERHLVWHFNKARRDEPTATALTGQFRQEYLRQGLLKFLVARASLGEGLEDWKKDQERRNRPRPNLSLWIDEVGPDPKKRDGLGRVPVTSKRVTLKLSIADFPLDETDSVQWQWDGGPWQAFPKHTGMEWTTKLSEVPWKRGTNKLRAILRTEGDGPQGYSEELTVSYQPPPPQVRFQGEKRQVTQDPSFRFKAEVIPAEDCPEVNIVLSQKHDNKELLAEDQRKAGPAIDAKLALKPGLNTIELVARNQGALKGAEDNETARLTVEVIYTKKDAPPQVSLEVESLPGGAKTKVEAGRPIIVHSPKVRLTGVIAAEGNLIRADWQRDDGKRTPLSGFAGGKEKSVKIDETFVLQPSLKPVDLHFYARTASSEEAEHAVQIAYHPELPRMALTAPADELVLYEGEDKPAVKVEGNITWPAEGLPCKARLVVNGLESDAVDLDKTMTLFSQPATLAAGDNRIQVRLTNAWKKTSTTDAILVKYLRPPHIRIIADHAPLVSRKPLIALEAQIESAVAVKLIRAEVNGAGGRRVVAAKLIAPGKGAKADLWRVQLGDIALDPGKNEVSLWASNTEASSRKTASLTVVYEPPPKPPQAPEVEMVQPALDVKVTKSDLTVQARVKSSGPLKRVDLIREGRASTRISFDLAGAKPNAQGFYEIATQIKLVPQDNVLRLEAVNAGGGRQSAPIAVSYIPQSPVRVEVQHLLAKGSSAKILPLISSNENGISFGTVDASRIWIAGQVTWDPESDALLANDKEYQIDLYVNGRRQLPVDLEPATGKDRVRTFKAEMSLTRGKDNLLQIDLPPALKRNADNRARYLVDCKKPAERQRVYLLPIAVGAKDEKKLLDQVFGALQAKDINLERERFRTPVFYEGRLYGPLSGYVNRRQVLTQLNRIKQEMIDQKKYDLRTSADAPTDVLLLYFRGSDSVASGSYELRTSDRRIAISRSQLLKEFSETLGAQILLLDVDREGKSDSDGNRLVRWPDDSRVSLFRSSRLDPKLGGKSESFLIDAFGEALRRASKLGEVAGEAKTLFEAMVKPSAKLTFDDFYPDSLADLVLSVKK